MRQESRKVTQPGGTLQQQSGGSKHSLEVVCTQGWAGAAAAAWRERTEHTDDELTGRGMGPKEVPVCAEVIEVLQ